MAEVRLQRVLSLHAHTGVARISQVISDYEVLRIKAVTALFPGGSNFRFGLLPLGQSGIGKLKSTDGQAQT